MTDAMLTGQEPGNFHIIILNDDLDKAYAELREFVFKNVEEKERGLFFSFVNPAQVFFLTLHGIFVLECV